MIAKFPKVSELVCVVEGLVIFKHCAPSIIIEACVQENLEMEMKQEYNWVVYKIMIR